MFEILCLWLKRQFFGQLVCFPAKKSISSRSDKNMMGLQNLCTLFGPTLMKLSPPNETLQVEDMNKEIKESMQQAQVLFYILQLHSDDKLIGDNTSSTVVDLPTASSSSPSSGSMGSARAAGAPQQQQQSESNRRRSIDSSQNQLIIDNNNNNLVTTTNPSSSSSHDRFTKLSMQTAL